MTCTGTATFASAGVGTGKTVTASGLTLSGRVGCELYLVVDDGDNHGEHHRGERDGLGDGPEQGVRRRDRRDAAGCTPTGVINAMWSPARARRPCNRGRRAGKTVTVSGLTLSGANAGNYALSSTTATTTASITKATPTITWPTPANIVFGTALSATQLNATAGSVPGSFVYSPPAGTVPSVGAGQTLSVTFTPTDTTDYNTATANVLITVAQGRRLRRFPATGTPFPRARWTSKVTGLDWARSATPSLAFGTSINLPLDSIAVLGGTWGADQSAMATVHRESADRNDPREVELLLRFSIKRAQRDWLSRILVPAGWEPKTSDCSMNGAVGGFTSSIRTRVQPEERRSGEGQCRQHRHGLHQQRGHLLGDGSTYTTGNPVRASPRRDGHDEQ